MKQKAESLEGVAVIGLACRFPGARNCHEFWNNLTLGIDLRGRPSLDEDLAQTLAAHSGDAEERRRFSAIDLFDAEFFNVEAREAALLDPQQRIFLECAWEAMEDSGHDLTSFPGSVGMFAACGDSVYTRGLLSHPELLESPGAGFILNMNSAGRLANRVARHLNLYGPSLVVQAGRSSSVIAISNACRSLLSYECDVALAGGISVHICDEAAVPDYRSGDLYEAHPNGSASVENVRGVGCGVLVLRRLTGAIADRDMVRAVIRGAAVNTDGGPRSNPIQAGVDSQAEVIALAQAIAGVSSGDVSYVEGGGSCDPVADRVEMAALMRVFQEHSSLEQRCALGSARANVGNLGPASGMASIIKTILALQHQQIPPTLHFSKRQILEKPAPPFYVGSSLLPWPRSGKPRYAGVSAFELGGGNAHVILEESPCRIASRKSRSIYLLMLSAKNPQRCDRLRKQLAQQFETGNLDLEEASYTLQVGRHHFPWRFSVVCSDRKDAISALRAGGEDDIVLGTEGVPVRPVFLFPGLGNHYPGMSVRLYDAEPVFAEHMDRCCSLLKNELGADPRNNILSPEHAKKLAAVDSPEAIDFARMVSNRAESPGELDSPEVAQPALFAVEYALARLFLHWGVRPSAMAGYSIGEYVAACLAGVFSLEDALRIVAKRSLLAKSLDSSSMLAVPLSEAEARELANKDIDVCGVHGPRLCVLGGTSDAILALQSLLQEKGVACRQLRATRAFHTNLMKPIAPILRSSLAEVDLRPPSIPYISNVTGGWIEAAKATSPDYWMEHLCAPVRFSSGIKTLGEASHRLFLEVGPGKSLAGLVHAQLQSDGIDHGVCIATLPSVYEINPDQRSVVEALGNLWKNGASCDWEQFHEGESPQRASISISPIQGQRYWMDALPAQAPQKTAANTAYRETVPGPETVLVRSYPASENFSAESYREIKDPPSTDTERKMASIWSKKLEVPRVGAHDDFFRLGGDSLIAMQILAEVRALLGIRIELQNFLRTPTVAALAAHADKKLSVSGHSRIPK